jgi:hypothetical protein
MKNIVFKKDKQKFLKTHSKKFLPLERDGGPAGDGRDEIRIVFFKSISGINHPVKQSLPPLLKKEGNLQK